MATTLKTKNSVTTTVTPTTLAQGELAVNITDKKMWVGNAATTPVQILGAGATNRAGGSNTQVQYNSSGDLAGSANMVFDGSTLTTLNSAYTGTLTGGTGVVNLGSGQFYKDASGNVGIGTSSPSSFGKLAVSSGAASNGIGIQQTDGSNTSQSIGLGLASGGLYGTKITALTNYGSTLDTQLAFYTNAATTLSERMRIDSSGNVGIGTSSPSQKLDVVGSAKASANVFCGDAYAFVFGTGTTSYWTGSSSTNYIAAITSGSERMRINSSGSLLIGTTSTGVTNTKSIIADLGAEGYLIVNHTGTASGTVFEYFGYNGGAIGSISQSGTTAVLYNTTSDYRLKTDVTPIKNALNTVEALNPVSFTWVDGRKDDGFLAHEIQAVIPNCVTGEKDAVNKDGTPKYQQMDSSGVIPFLVKAIQEQQAMIETLTTRLNALEGK